MTTTAASTTITIIEPINLPAYAKANVLPQDPPSTTPHVSIFRCRRSLSMSSTSLGVVFSTSDPSKSSAAFGIDFPLPRLKE